MQKAKVNRGSPSSHNSNRRVASINSSASPTTRFSHPATINLTSLFLSSISLSLSKSLFQNAFARRPPLLHGRVLRTRRPRRFIDDFHFLRFIGLLKVTFVQAVTLD